mgnify:CR=1 FL=1
MLTWTHWMKATNRRAQRLQPLQPVAEEKLSKLTFQFYFMGKAGSLICLFLLGLAAPSKAQTWNFDDSTRAAYQLVLDLRTDEARKLLASTQTITGHYVLLLANSLELALTEDKKRFAASEDWFRQLLDDYARKNDPASLLLMAEAHLQWSFIYVKFGHELEGAFHLARAYELIEATRERSTDLVPSQKTFGLVQVILGAVPDQYNWLMSLMGLDGSMDYGLKALADSVLLECDFALEASLMGALINGFILQRPKVAEALIDEILDQESSPNYLTTYVAALLAIKDSKSERALTLLNTIADRPGALPLHYANYLRGEIFLHKAVYDSATSCYEKFLAGYSGQNFRKDARYKIGVCHWLSGDDEQARIHFERAENEGVETSEADRSAAASLRIKTFPHRLLSKARYAMDGGYFEEARRILSAIADGDVSEKSHQIEYYYRRARLEHLTMRIQPAKLFYGQTIDLAADEPLYFAPNSCLQMGYILVAEKNIPEAKKYFRRALKYRKHEYKNSIDSKARSALNSLR